MPRTLRAMNSITILNSLVFVCLQLKVLLCVLQVFVERQNELSRLEQKTRQLTEELNMAKRSSQGLKDTLEETEREKKVNTNPLCIHANYRPQKLTLAILTWPVKVWQMILWHFRNGFCTCTTSKLKIVIKQTTKDTYVLVWLASLLCFRLFLMSFRRERSSWLQRRRTL